jgi:hypothetical protein
MLQRPPVAGIPGARLARAEPALFAALAVAAGLPMLLSAYPPTDDGPEHLLHAWLSRELAIPGSIAHAAFVPNPGGAVPALTTRLLELLLGLMPPVDALRGVCFALPVLLAFAVRANLPVMPVIGGASPPAGRTGTRARPNLPVIGGASPPAGRTGRSRGWTTLFIPALVLDVSFYKGFINFYAGAVALFATTACLAAAERRAASETRTPTPWLAAAGAMALVTLACHVFAFALLLFVVAVRFGLARAPAAPALALRRIAPALLPAVACGAWVLVGLVAPVRGAGVTLPAGHPLGWAAIAPDYAFGPLEKLSGFISEGWRNLAGWQVVPPAVAFAALLVLWLARRNAALGRRWLPPPLSASLFLLYLALPEGLPGWSWVSIRVPLLVALTLVIEVGGAEVEPRLGGAAALLASCLAVGSAVLTTTAVRGLGEQIAAWVAAADRLPKERPILPIYPPTHPAIGRVNVIHHASAYLTMQRGVVYPEVFAGDSRRHRALVRPEVERGVFGLAEPLSWADFVSAERRAAWFESTPGAVALRFEPEGAAPDAIDARLLAASASSEQVAPGVRLYRRRELEPGSAESSR